MSEEVTKKAIDEDRPEGYSFWDDVIGELKNLPKIEKGRVKLSTLRKEQPVEEKEEEIDTEPIRKLLAEIRKKVGQSIEISLLDNAEDDPGCSGSIWVLANHLAEKKHLAEAKALLTIPRAGRDRFTSPQLRFRNDLRMISLLARIAERESDWETAASLLLDMKKQGKLTNVDDMRRAIYALNRLNRQEEAVWVLDSYEEKVYMLQNPVLVENYIVAMKGANENIEKRFREIIGEFLRNGEKEKLIFKAIAGIFKGLNAQSYARIVVSIAESFSNEYTFNADCDITIQRAFAHEKLGEFEKIVDLLTLPDGRGLRFDNEKTVAIFNRALGRLKRPT